MAESKLQAKVVKTSSQAGSDRFGFKYASLSDMVESGVDIPKMRLTVRDGLQFVEYFDGSDWQLGAQVITAFESKGMNACQAYGSALTYARRYTVQMAMQVAVDDDKNVETAGASARAESYTSKSATAKQIETIQNILGKEKAKEVIAKNQPLSIAKASKIIATLSAKKQQVDADKETEPVSLSEIPF